MKTKIKKIGMPMIVALIAIVGAFAGNVSSKNDTASLTDRLGHTITCQPTNVMCTVDGSFICTDINSNTLYDWNGTDCPLPLKREF
jgi:hypothetical protein